jgi:hypothetical protein
VVRLLLSSMADHYIFVNAFVSRFSRLTGVEIIQPHVGEVHD